MIEKLSNLVFSSRGADVGSVTMSPSFRPFSDPRLNWPGKRVKMCRRSKKDPKYGEGRSEEQLQSKREKKKLIGSEDMRQRRTGADVCHLLSHERQKRQREDVREDVVHNSF